MSKINHDYEEPDKILPYWNGSGQMHLFFDDGEEGVHIPYDELLEFCMTMDNEDTGLTEGQRDSIMRTPTPEIIRNWPIDGQVVDFVTRDGKFHTGIFDGMSGCFISGEVLMRSGDVISNSELIQHTEILQWAAHDPDRRIT